MLRRKIHIHFNSYKKHFFSQLINKEKHDKITGNVIMFDKRKGYGFISMTYTKKKKKKKKKIYIYSQKKNIYYAYLYLYLYEQ
ncbi:hypothetical protein PFMALIP_00078 [Plasmodium falciparum MaliPS096_E11]|uniref:CSD domain-containing protein n=1 Tax=Plasmodium falciparum MaliPS096_E11 TaxID=1036727 RepID=A0A024WY86_PLAFA|nr:hypothetical protein PFMALIP_00078 [Plasmodium falciparum MaliPS096_E11]